MRRLATLGVLVAFGTLAIVVVGAQQNPNTDGTRVQLSASGYQG